jgi:curli biogenesis system outer membrane secretion channel CsgG
MLITLSLVISCTSGINNAVQSVAVWDIDNLSPEGASPSDLGELLSIEVIKAIQESGRYSVIERERLFMALEELNLGSTALVDENTRLKLGQISSAQLMVFGGYQVIGDTMRLDLRLVDVETGRIRKAVKKITAAENISGWLDSAKSAAEELL